MVKAGLDMDGDIPLDAGKRIIISALREFDPQLGRRAADILHDPDRLKVFETPSRETGMMQYRPARLTMADLPSLEMDMDPEAFKERFGEHFPFTKQDNPDRDYGIIDYEYTYTKNSVLYLAHELGHAIADDVQRENGKTFRDFSPDALEKQAYFIQSIVSQKIAPEFNNESVSFRDDGAIDLTKVFCRKSQRFGAQTVFEEAQMMPLHQRSAFISEVLGGVEVSKDETSSTAARPSAQHYKKS